MKWKYAAICAMTVLLLTAAVLIGWEDTLSFRLQTAGGSEILYPQRRSSGEYTVYLPSAASPDQLRTLQPLRLDGKKWTNGSCKDLETDRPYQLSAGKHSGTLTFLQSKNVGTLYIHTASRDMDYVHREKGNKEPGTFRLYTPDGTLDAAGDLSFLKARGNSTFTYAAKKAYSLKLSAPQDLLGMGAAEKWILLADAFDPSHIRNKIVYDFAAAAGLPFSPDSRWVDLYLNGNYAGLYLLTERNEIHRERVDIPQTGSFLVSAEAPERMEEQNLPSISLDSGTTLRIHQSDLDPGAMKDLWQSAENAILSEDGLDPVTGKHWRELIDLDSWARKYLIEEIFGNHDGGRLSQFYYLAEGKIHAGPVWDYDYAIANRDIYEAPAPNMFYVNQPYERHGSLWLSRLYQDETFHSYVKNLYKTQFRPLLEALVTEKLDQYSAAVGQASSLDRRRWDTASPAEERAAIRTYLSGRLEFLNQIWVEEADFVEVHANRLGRWANYVLFPGDTLPELPQRDGCAWYVSGTDTLLDEYAPVIESMEIELRETPEALEKE